MFFEPQNVEVKTSSFCGSLFDIRYSIFLSLLVFETATRCDHISDELKAK